MQIEIRKMVSEYPKQKWELALAIFETPMLFICLLVFLLLVACECYYENTISSDHDTIFIGGIFSYFGLILVTSALAINLKRRKKFREQMTPPTEFYYVILNDHGFERGVEHLWGENKSWRLLTGFDERSDSFWLKFGQKAFPIFKYEFNQAADMDELRRFLTEKTRHK